MDHDLGLWSERYDQNSRTNWNDTMLQTVNFESNFPSNHRGARKGSLCPRKDLTLKFSEHFLELESEFCSQRKWRWKNQTCDWKHKLSLKSETFFIILLLSVAPNLFSVSFYCFISHSASTSLRTTFNRHHYLNQRLKNKHSFFELFLWRSLLQHSSPPCWLCVSKRQDKIQDMTHISTQLQEYLAKERTRPPKLFINTGFHHSWLCESHPFSFYTAVLSNIGTLNLHWPMRKPLLHPLNPIRFCFSYRVYMAPSLLMK